VNQAPIEPCLRASSEIPFIEPQLEEFQRSQAIPLVDFLSTFI
jgi:hypothetical protein